MDWTKVINDPLGFSGFALALVFSLAGRLLQKRHAGQGWILPAVIMLAAVCIFGGLALAYRRASPASPPEQPVTTVRPTQTDPADRSKEAGALSENTPPAKAPIVTPPGSVQVNGSIDQKGASKSVAVANGPVTIGNQK